MSAARKRVRILAWLLLECGGRRLRRAGGGCVMRLYFVELRVRDWSASVAWYRDVLGLELLLRDESGSFALFAAGGARLALKAGEPCPGGSSIAFEVDDLSAWVERLGERIEGPIKSSAEGYRRALLRDPDGYEITLFEWLRGDQA
jgi:catechol 2,3-dioxygenase-like lactoylglutathione lyase family enzyme